jgi:putative transposase
MHLLRECVRLHHYLPSKFAMDNGKEFKSTYFQRLLASCWITPEYRPPRNARFGGQMERFFSTANTEMFHQMLGNTKAMKNPRQVSKSVNPETTAVWTLETLYETVSEFCYVTYNNHMHSTFGCTPNERFKQGILKHGERLGREREYDDSFIKLTLPTTPHGTLTIGRNGIRMFGGFSYYADEMAKCIGQKVPVCYDPEDVSKVYVFLNKRWIWAQTVSLHVRGLLNKLSRRSLHIATKEFFAEQKRKNAAETFNEAAMGKFLKSTKCQEALAVQRKIDQQFQDIEQEKVGEQHGQKAVKIPEEFSDRESSRPSLAPPRPLKTLAISPPPEI